MCRSRWARIVVTLVGVAAGAIAAPAAAQPTLWLSVGGHGTVETGRLGDLLGSEGGALLGLGAHVLRLGPALLGLEAEATGGRATADLGTTRDHVTILRGRFGVRATWWPEDAEPRLVPYFRVGGVYRRDEGDLIDDDGFGWYAGLGLDWQLAPGLAAGPFVTYEAVSLSVESRTWLFGLVLTLSR